MEKLTEAQQYVKNLESLFSVFFDSSAVFEPDKANNEPQKTSPILKITEDVTPSSFIINYYIPGIEKDKINVKSTKENLVVDINGFVVTEKISRLYTPQQSNVTYNNGVLKIEMPLAEESKPVNLIIG